MTKAEQAFGALGGIVLIFAGGNMHARIVATCSDPEQHTYYHDSGLLCKVEDAPWS